MARGWGRDFCTSPRVSLLPCAIRRLRGASLPHPVAPTRYSTLPSPTLTPSHIVHLVPLPQPQSLTPTPPSRPPSTPTIPTPPLQPPLPHLHPPSEMHRQLFLQSSARGHLRSALATAGAIGNWETLAVSNDKHGEGDTIRARQPQRRQPQQTLWGFTGAAGAAVGVGASALLVLSLSRRRKGRTEKGLGAGEGGARMTRERAGGVARTGRLAMRAA